MITVDAIKKETVLDKIPLEWVGMGAITLPIKLMAEDVVSDLDLAAKVSVFVNLISASRGIHMSRIYKLLQDYSQTSKLSFLTLQQLGKEIILSQSELSDSVKIEFSLQLPIRNQTLKSKINYQKLYPIVIKYTKDKTQESIGLEIKLDYSSTCPQSAALANEVLIKNLRAKDWKSTADLISFLEERGPIATPHAQRSELELSLQLNTTELLGRNAMAYIDHVLKNLEEVLGTPTQGVVKRVDEQEFAVLNANNLMFCEDAARKIKLCLDARLEVLSYKGMVTHLESLHSHNAVAMFERINRALT
jgi:GTP cyclohydrolase I